MTTEMKRKKRPWSWLQTVGLLIEVAAVILIWRKVIPPLAFWLLSGIAIVVVILSSVKLERITTASLPIMRWNIAGRVLFILGVWTEGASLLPSFSHVREWPLLVGLGLVVLSFLCSLRAMVIKEKEEEKERAERKQSCDTQ